MRLPGCPASGRDAELEAAAPVTRRRVAIASPLREPMTCAPSSAAAEYAFPLLCEIFARRLCSVDRAAARERRLHRARAAASAAFELVRSFRCCASDV